LNICILIPLYRVSQENHRMDNLQQRPRTEIQESKELDLLRLKKLIQRARKASQKAKEAENEVFNLLRKMEIDLDVETEAENADTLEDAISCYICYNEFGLLALMKEIREWYLN